MEEEKKKEDEEDKIKEINAWLLSFRHPFYKEFPEWLYGVKNQYWDLK